MNSMTEVGAPRIEKCGNHWCVEWFVEDRFYSHCFKTWAECKERAEWAIDCWSDHWKRAATGKETP